ncbi:MAG: NAD(P)H-dependent oxidoreductase [Phycisphaeraceae bacterium]|nr:NAD(P)H-dependent oxidoreductase [Phycisphaeraceae bacterium]
MAKILAFAGSARKDSLNKKLVKLAADMAQQKGVQVTVIDLVDYPMPLYDGDLEEAQGAPENATRLYQLIKEYDGLLIACPEYNSSITPLLKNTIDWLSRPREGEKPLAAFNGKVAGLLAASPGALGGLRGLTHVREILSNIGVLVIPSQVAVPQAHEAFAADGSLVDQKTHMRLDGLANNLTATVKAMAR